MKFKAVMYESLSMKNLAFIGNTLMKLIRNCVLRLNPSEMSFLVCEENSSPKQVLVWCLLEAKQFFNEFVVEAVPPAHEIYLEFPTDTETETTWRGKRPLEMLSSSLSSLKGGNSSARSVKIKLTQKISPCLTVEIELMSEIGISRTCVHDIPVRVLQKALWSELSSPPSHSYTTVVEVKNLKKMRSVTERLKKLCTQVSLKPSKDSSSPSCGGTGSLTISASTLAVTVSTIFKNLTFLKSSSSSSSDGDVDESAVRVDTKKLWTLLCCEALNPKRTSCSFLGSRLLHVLLYCDLFQVHFYLTSIEE